jgi:C4-dicarboxylate-specific signal transduction histidine kinase
MRASALGELAASIAHEVRQPLAAIAANAAASSNWLTKPEPRVAEAREALAAIVSDSERAGEVISRMQRLLARSPVPRGPCEMNQVILEVLRLVRSQLEGQRVVVDADLAVGLPEVLGDQVQLQQVLLNLLLNAVDACRDFPGTERRRVRVRTVTEVEHGVLWVVVAVRDAGRGIEPEARGRLFDPFFSTKPAGLGMGLSISRSIVEHHGGRLTATPNERHGATFAFRLPALP